MNFRHLGDFLNSEGLLWDLSQFDNIFFDPILKFNFFWIISIQMVHIWPLYIFRKVCTHNPLKWPQIRSSQGRSSQFWSSQIELGQVKSSWGRSSKVKAGQVGNFSWLKIFMDPEFCWNQNLVGTQVFVEHNISWNPKCCWTRKFVQPKKFCYFIIVKTWALLSGFV